MADLELWNSLKRAVQTSNLPQLTFLLAQHPSPATINHADEAGCTLLHSATYRHKSAIVQALVDAGANVDAVANSGCAPIHNATIFDYTNVIRVLIRAGANINLVTHGYNAPIVIALSKHYYDIARLLADAGAHIDPEYEAEHANELRLWTAVLRGDLDELRRRIDAGDSVDQAPQGGKVKGWTALWLAVVLGREDAARMLIQAGAGVDTVGYERARPLHLALYTDQTETAKLLVETNANVNAIDKYGHLPFQIAAQRCNFDMAEMLFYANASISTNLAVFQNLFSNGLFEVIKFIIENWESFEMREDSKYDFEDWDEFDTPAKDGKYLLHLAICRGHLEVAKSMVEFNGHTDQVDKFGKTPLHYLLSAGNEKVTSRSISDIFRHINYREHSFDPYSSLDDVIVDGATVKISPLVPSDVIRNILYTNTYFWLAANNKAPMLAAELAGGLDPNMKTENGMTLLHWACAGDAPECVQLLLDAGADKEAGDPKPIFYCMHKSSRCLENFINSGVAVNRSLEFNNQTRYPIHLALAANSPACVTALIGAGAWVTRKEMSVGGGISPLQSALEMRPVPVDALRALLVADGKRVLSERIGGMPPLHWAVERSTVDGVRVLVRGGANVNEKYGSNQETILKRAEHRRSNPAFLAEVPRLTAIVDYLKSLPCFSEEQ